MEDHKTLVSVPQHNSNEKHFEDVDELVEWLLRSIRRGEFEGDYAIGRCTADILNKIVSMAKKSDTTQNLIDKIKYFGSRMYKEKPTVFVIGNIVRRVLYTVREEYLNEENGVEEHKDKKEKESNKKSSPQPPADNEKQQNFLKPLDLTAKKLDSHKSTANLFGVFTPVNPANIQNFTFKSASEETNLPSSSYSQHKAALTKVLEMGLDRGQDTFQNPFNLIKPTVSQGIEDIIEELDTHYNAICEFAPEIIHTNEVILTVGLSHTVLFFLAEAVRKKRKFDVIVTQHAPDYSGNEMALKLSDFGINTTLIADSAVFGVMSRVNKVVVGASAVMANGGLIAKNGMHLIALAAKKHNVPMVVCSGIQKLTPLYPLDQESFNTNQNPSDVFPYANGEFLKHVNVLNPQFDYVPPNLIDLMVTNHGIHYPHYIYRLLNEFYDQSDNDLVEKPIENEQEEQTI